MTMPSQADWVRWGFLDPERAGLAATALESVRPGLAQMVGELLSSSADPDQGLVAFADLAAAGDVSGFDANQAGWQQLALLLGGSIGLGRWSRQRPIDLVAVTQGPSSLTKVPDILAHVLASDPATQIDELRWAYRRALAGIAAADLSDPDPLASLELTCEALTDIQDAVVEAAIIIARGLVPEAEKIRFGVVALGKVGAREANYLSDVDVLYVVEPAVVEGESACSAAEAVRIGTALAAKVMNICSAYTTAGTIWEIDATLRPEGAAGPLVRTLAGMRTYYESWAKNWEFQAMLKARAMAGDRSLAQGFVDMIAPLVWTAAERPGFVADAQAMRSRVVSLIPSVEANRDIKLGAGGLRDTEFSVQILQLVHGRLDERLRLPATLAGLNALIAYGYVGREDGAELAQAYRFQRLLEHRLQLYHLKRTHLMPTDEAGLRRLARSVGMKEADQVLAAWRTSAAKVLRLHQRIYYSPLLAAVARIPTSEIRLTQEAATIRLRALGYGDPSAALRHIEALTDGVSRRAEIMRQLLPALLGWIAAGPNPDAGLLAFRQVAEALGSTPFFLRALRDEGRLAQDLARVLSTSRYAASLMQRAPISVEVLLGGEQGNLSQELADVVNRYGADPRSAEIIRATRRRELLRIAAADILGTIDVCAVAQQLSELTDATLEAALTLARRSVEGAPPMAVIALGRWGGQEMAYASDADLMVVLEDSDDPEAIRKGAKVLSLLRDLLKVPGPDPDLEIDLGLRPEGKDGALVRSLESYVTYYQKWSATWEAQALIRARHGAGERALSDALLWVIEPIRYPEAGLSREQFMEIRRLKARMESERIGRGLDPRNHLKLGPGGLSDVEWTIQSLQLRHAGRLPELRVTGTLEALRQLVQADLVTTDDADALQDAFLLASRARNAVVLVRNQVSDLLPVDAAVLGQVARTLGYPGGSHLADEWYRVARRARDVADRLFWVD